MQLFSRPCTLLFCVLYCCCITGCFSSPAADETVAPAKQSTSQGIETNVTTVKAIYKEFDYPIRTYGKVRSMQDQLLTTETGGKLSILKVFSGERVNKDDVLAQFETAAVLQKAEHSKLTKFNSEREYESQLLSYENLLKDKSGSEAEDIRKKLRISSGLAGAELELKENIAELAKYTIRAPFSGVKDIEQTLSQEFCCYGYHNMTGELKEKGWIINHKKVYRLMREHKLLYGSRI